LVQVELLLVQFKVQMMELHHLLDLLYLLEEVVVVEVDQVELIIQVEQGDLVVGDLVIIPEMVVQEMLHQHHHHKVILVEKVPMVSLNILLVAEAEALGVLDNPQQILP
jgi:hypothetical protein